MKSNTSKKVAKPRAAKLNVSPSEIVRATSGAPGARLLGRTEAAERLGVSLSTVRRSEERGLLRAVVGEDGVHRVDAQQVETLTLTRSSTRVNGPSVQPTAISGQLTSEVFTLLEQGVHPVEICIRMSLPAELVKGLQGQSASMRDTLVLTKQDQAEIGTSAKTTPEFVTVLDKYTVGMARRLRLAEQAQSSPSDGAGMTVEPLQVQRADGKCRVSCTIVQRSTGHALMLLSNWWPEGHFFIGWAVELIEESSAFADISRGKNGITGLSETE